MKKVSDFFKRKAIIKRCIKHHVSNGFFLIENGEMNKLSLLSLIRYFFKMHKIYLFCNSKKKFHYRKGKIIFGSQKLSLLVDGKAFNFYLTKEKFDKALVILNSSYKQLKYPLVKIFDVDFNSLSFESELIAKEREYEIVDYILMSRKILDIMFLPSNHSSIEIGNHTLLAYLQHGDCHYNNFILTKNIYGFTVIDIDDINVYPAFFDYFYFCSFATKVGFSRLITDECIQKAMNRVLSFYGFNPLKNVVDYYLSGFVEYYINKINASTKNTINAILSWTQTFSNERFPLTNNAISCFKAKCMETKLL